MSWNERKYSKQGEELDWMFIKYVGMISRLEVCICILKTYRNPVHIPSWRQHEALLFIRQRGNSNLPPDSVIVAGGTERTTPTSLPLLPWTTEVLFNIPRSLVNLCSARETGIVLAYLKALPLAVHFTGTQLCVALWWTRLLFIRSAYLL